MPVIAGTTKESVINKAREVLREKEIPYTIEKTKTWFWVSSTKPVAAQTALREAGLEMNPITTMHSIWCTKCDAIRTFKKRAGDWICQKCGARLLMFRNPKKAKAMVHPQALESLKRYKSDIKAGHTAAAEYWRGQAGAYFTANPMVGDRYTPHSKATRAKYPAHILGDKIIGGKLYGLLVENAVVKGLAEGMAEDVRSRGGKARLVLAPGTKNYYHVWVRDYEGNPDFLKKTAAQRRVGYALGKELGLEPVMARRTRDWRSPKVYRMLGLPVPPLSERKAMGLVNPRFPKDPNDWTSVHYFWAVESAWRAFEKYENYRGDLRGKTGTKLYQDYLRKRKLAVDMRTSHFSYEPDPKLPNPLTAKEKREIVNLANTQFAISRKYSDQPVRSSFWYGRSVGMGKIAKMFNPAQNPLMCPKCRETVAKVRVPSTVTGRMTTIGYCRTCDKRYKLYELAFNPKMKNQWDPITEALEGDEDEDIMIGIEINPSETTRMLKALVTKSDLKEIKSALGTPKIGNVLRKVCGRYGLRNTLQVYSALIELTGTKLNPLGAFICGRCGKRFHSMEALNTHLLKIHKVRNPLTAIGSAALTGVGIGAGFKAVDYAWNRLGFPRVKKNPVKPKTTKYRGWYIRKIEPGVYDIHSPEGNYYGTEPSIKKAKELVEAYTEPYANPKPHK